MVRSVCDSTLSLSGEEGPCIGHRRILVVDDDNQDVCVALTLLPASLGLTCEIAETGEDVISRTADSQPGVILPDPIMPELNKLGAIIWLHSNPATQWISETLTTALHLDPLTSHRFPGVVSVIHKRRFTSTQRHTLLSHSLS